MPPKQATKGQKQIHEENSGTLRFYLTVIVAVNACYFVLQRTFFWESFTSLQIFMCVIAIVVYVGGYKFMASMAKAKYDQNGSLIDAGIDLNLEKGMAEHAKDAILLTAIVQLFSLVSVYFWLGILIAPSWAIYLLWVNILGPWFFAPAQEVSEKKSKKLERKKRS